MIIGLTNSKGGSTKTTIAANLGGLLAEARNKRVLLIDADRQDSLSKYFDIKNPSAKGITHFIIEQNDFDQVISKTTIDGLDIIYSDIAQSGLETTLVDRADGRFRLRAAIHKIKDQYDFVIVDTRGAEGPLMDMTILASDLILVPVPAEKVSAAELTITLNAIDTSRESAETIGFTTGPAFFYMARTDYTNDSKTICDSVRAVINRIAESQEKQNLLMLDTDIPTALAFRQAATNQMPVHLFERTSRTKRGSAASIMNTFADEILTKYNMLACKG